MRNIRMKLLAGAGTLALVGGIAFASTGQSAHASEPNCQLVNYCGTLHGVDAGNAPIALDAKRKADLGLDIGYPDLSNDQATSFALVEHLGRGHFTYQDKTITVSSSSDSLTGVLSSDNEVLTITLPGDIISTDAITGALSGLPGVASAVTFKAGVATTSFPAWLRPGTYALTVAVTDTPAEGPAVTTTYTLTFGVTATEVYVPATPVYSIAYVTPDGTWTSDCVTALGNGLLKNEPCTLGLAPDQLFSFYSVTSGVLSTGPVAVSNASPTEQYAVLSLTTGRYVEDQSVANPLTPLSDAADAVPGSGRELDADGPATALWSFDS